MTVDQARDTLEMAYKADVAVLAEKAYKQIVTKKLSGESAAEAVFDVVAESPRCRNVGYAVEALIFSDHDLAIMNKHNDRCGCLDWSDSTIWSHFAAHAITADVISAIHNKYGLVVVAEAPSSFRPHGSPDGMFS